jgi:ATP/maltotriose-dependent transcriptional regulator MalT
MKIDRPDHTNSISFKIAAFMFRKVSRVVIGQVQNSENLFSRFKEKLYLFFDEFHKIENPLMDSEKLIKFLLKRNSHFFIFFRL